MTAVAAWAGAAPAQAAELTLRPSAGVVDWLAGPATSLTLEPASQVRVVNTENCVTAVPRDANNQATADRLIRFVVSGANPTVGASRSDFFGARFCYTGQLAGEDQITAYVDEDEGGVDDESEPTATATKLWLAERAVLTVSPEQSSAPVGSNHTVTATVTTAGGTPLPGVFVDFDADGLVWDGCTVALQEVTDSAGHAFCTYTSDEARQVNLVVRADVDNDGFAREIARHSWLSGDATTIDLRPEFALHQVGGAQGCVTVRDVKDAEGRFAGDKLVQVEITGAHPGTVSVRTNVFGNVGFCYPGVRAGDDRITAFVDNNENGVDDGAAEPEAALATITWFSDLPVLSLTPPSGSAVVRTTRTVTARLTTADGAPIAGIPITFHTDSPSANTVICDDFLLTLPTDAQGEVSCVYSGTRPGMDQIRAVADLDNNVSQTSEVAVGSATFTWTSGDADLLRLEPETGLAELGDEECLTASASDDGGESGFVQAVDKVVLLTVTGANEASDSARTDQHGRAELCYTPTNAGDDTITAFVDNNENGVDDGDSEPEATATRHWLEPLPVPVVSLTPEDSTGPVGSTHTLTATVTTEEGTPLPDEEVLFEDEGGPNFYFCDPEPELTDSQGQTTCSYMGEEPGTDTVRAFVDLNGDFFPQPDEPSDIATRTWDPIPAETLAVQGARLEVRNSLAPTSDPGRFALQIDGVTVPGSGAVGHGGATGQIPLAAGPHSVREQGAPGTDLSRYQSSISCRNAGGTGAVVAAVAGPGPMNVNLTPGAHVVCTIMNLRVRPPSCSRVVPSPAALRPTDGRLRLVTLYGAVQLKITRVTQDEPLARGRRGKRRSAATAPGGRSVWLRASRARNGDGRVYRLRFRATDSRGAVCRGVVRVGVPRYRKKAAVDSAPPSYGSFVR